MSVHISSAVWKLALNPTAKLILLRLADCADHDGKNAYPSVKTIASDCGLGESTVREHLAELRASGILAVQRRSSQHFPTIYAIKPDLQNPDLQNPDLQQAVPRPPATGVRPPATGPDPSRSVRDPSNTTTTVANAAVFAAIENLQGSLTSFVTDAVNAELDDGVNPDWIIAACDEAALANVRRWKYVAAILKNWRENGFRSKAGGRNGRGDAGNDRKKQADARARGGKW